jgi:hypothetical protein
MRTTTDLVRRVSRAGTISRSSCRGFIEMSMQTSCSQRGSYVRRCLSRFAACGSVRRPCIIGGLFGVPIGIWLLNHLPSVQNMVARYTSLTQNFLCSIQRVVSSKFVYEFFDFKYWTASYRLYRACLFGMLSKVFTVIVARAGVWSRQYSPPRQEVGFSDVT